MSLVPPKILHIEPTDACQAACPQCAREIGPFDKQDLHHLTLDQIKNTIAIEHMRGLDKMYMCGVYGDPAAGRHTLDIYRHFRQVNPDITLGMYSNGGLRNTTWWRDLASIIHRPRDYAIFSIDGLEDTNPIYRVNVNWHKVMENAQAFIQAGGNAHWDMLVFEHNEHQVDQCEQLARDMGFKFFRAKISRRHDIAPIRWLKQPKHLEQANVFAQDGDIRCQALQESSLYLSATGKLQPCCFLGVTDYTLDQFGEVQSSWSRSPIQQCADACTQSSNGHTNFSNQWRRETDLSDK